MKVARQLSAEKLQEAETVASPQVTVVSQPEITSCVDRTSAVSQLYRYLTSEA